MPDGGDNPHGKGRPNLAKDVGVGTARFFGNIALLPFTSSSHFPLNRPGPVCFANGLLARYRVGGQ